MNGPERYSKLQGRVPTTTDGVELGYLEGLDPVTGLPVLIYDFGGEPSASPGDVDSENIPRILWSGVDRDRGRIVAALSPGWQRLAADSAPLTLEQLLEASAALRAAEAAAVAHGDLAPWRLLLVGDRLQVEGFGVPWRPRPGPHRAPEVTDVGTAAGDVWSLASVVREIGVAASDETIAAVLEQCMAQDPAERPSAEELFLALEALASPEESEAGRAVAAESSGATTVADAPGKDEPASEATDEAGPAAKAPGKEGQASREAARHGSTTTMAAAAPLEPGEPKEGPGEKRRRLTLLGALMAGVVILALLALYGPRGSDPPAPRPLEDVVYVVEVNVVPADLPPVTIHLIRVPEGSSLARSDSIGTAPRHLALDRAGTWAFQGSLQGRRSEVVEIEVPRERTVTLVMPEAER